MADRKEIDKVSENTLYDVNKYLREKNVLHKDRLTIFGYEMIEWFYNIV